MMARPTSFNRMRLGISVNWRRGGPGCPAFYSGPHMFARELGDGSHRGLVGVTVCGEVPKVGNACDEAAVVLAIDHRPVPDSVHALPSARRTPPDASAGEN